MHFIEVAIFISQIQYVFISFSFIAFPPYSYVCSNRFQTQRMLNPETLLEHQSSVTNVGNSRHFSEINVTQPNTGFPAVPMNTD